MSFDIFVITYRVTNFLPKLVDMLLFSTEKPVSISVACWGDRTSGLLYVPLCSLAGHGWLYLKIGKSKNGNSVFPSKTRIVNEF